MGDIIFNFIREVFLGGLTSERFPELLAVPITLFLVVAWVYFSITRKKYWSLFLSIMSAIIGGLVGFAYSAIAGGLYAILYFVFLPFWIVLFAVAGGILGYILDKKRKSMDENKLH
ncbi:MAG: hypothetical protein G01um101466_594 [Parcubacteria group bacterium Gr01-1014_66]|nr:MAG: hypothetical protein G01um101466_594 [Parcubacteria group bacterium Gr01-1014_66]